MLSQSKTRALAAIFAVGVTVSGCSEIYFDRRETVSLGAGDAIASNKVTQVIDPWPRSSANDRFSYNGQRAQAAQDRYNRGKAITPVLPTATSKDYQSIQQQAAGQQPGPATSAAPAAPVRGPGSNP
jgi:hypothetical protein